MNPLIGLVTIKHHNQDDLLELLSFGGLPLHQLDSITKIHNYASSGACYAIIVPKRIVKLYKVISKVHLYNSRSPLIIIEYFINQDNIYTFTVHALTKDIHSYEYQEDPQKVLDIIKKALEAGIEYKKQLVNSCIQYNIKHNVSNTSTAEPKLIPIFSHEHTIKTIEISEVQKQRMTPMLWKLLLCLDKKQEKGISIKELEKSLWPTINETKSKKEDIQAYVSKLRKILNINAENDYTIHFQDNSYFLVKKIAKT